MADEEQIDMEVEDEGYGPLPQKSDEKILEESKVIEHVSDAAGDELQGHLEAPVEFVEVNEGFFDILEQAGISKRGFIWFFIILLIVITGLVFLLFGVFSSDESGVSELPVVDSADLTFVPDFSGDDVSFMASYLFGREFALGGRTDAGFLGISSAYNVGVVADPYRADFVSYLNLLRDMQNIYDIDLYALMDLSVNRSEALDAHLQEMYDLLMKADLYLAKINEELVRLDLKFSTVADDSAVYEESFFTSLDGLMGVDSYENLNLFIGAEQDVVKIRALYNAYDLISQKITNSLEFLTPRYDDIVANKAALIEGVKVFDVPGSDIDAIVPLQ
jgi:hypothetical protein